MAGMDKCVSLLLSQGEPGCMKESLLEPSGCAFALTGRLWGSALDVEGFSEADCSNRQADRAGNSCSLALNVVCSLTKVQLVFN